MRELTTAEARMVAIGASQSGLDPDPFLLRRDKLTSEMSRQERIKRAERLVVARRNNIALLDAISDIEERAENFGSIVNLIEGFEEVMGIADDSGLIDLAAEHGIEISPAIRHIKVHPVSEVDLKLQKAFRGWLVGYIEGKHAEQGEQLAEYLNLPRMDYDLIVSRLHQTTLRGNLKTRLVDEFKDKVRAEIYEDEELTELEAAKKVFDSEAQTIMRARAMQEFIRDLAYPRGRYTIPRPTRYDNRPAPQWTGPSLDLLQNIHQLGVIPDLHPSTPTLSPPNLPEIPTFDPSIIIRDFDYDKQDFTRGRTRAQLNAELDQAFARYGIPAVLDTLGIKFGSRGPYTQPRAKGWNGWSNGPFVGHSLGDIYSTEGVTLSELGHSAAHGNPLTPAGLSLVGEHGGFALRFNPATFVVVNTINLAVHAFRSGSRRRRAERRTHAATRRWFEQNLATASDNQLADFLDRVDDRLGPDGYLRTEPPQPLRHVGMHAFKEIGATL